MSTRRTRARPVAGSSSCGERHRHEVPGLHRHHRGVAALEQVLGRAVAEVARVLHVVGDRVGAAQLVADVLGDDRARGSRTRAGASAPRACRISPMLTSAMRTWPWSSRSTSSSSARSAGSMSSTTPSAITATPSRRPSASRLMCAPTSVSTMRAQPDRLGAELLGDERQRGAGRLADAERQVAGLAAHRDHEVPARGGLGVDHQVLDDLDADVARGLVAERVDVTAAGRGRCRWSWARARRGSGPPPSPRASSRERRCRRRRS